MAREAKAKAASCWLDRIIVTGAVMRHRTWGQNMCGSQVCRLRLRSSSPRRESKRKGSW